MDVDVLNNPKMMFEVQQDWGKLLAKAEAQLKAAKGNN